jgi:hypothetical protein
MTHTTAGARVRGDLTAPGLRGATGAKPYDATATGSSRRLLLWERPALRGLNERRRRQGEPWPSVSPAQKTGPLGLEAGTCDRKEASAVHKATETEPKKHGQDIYVLWALGTSGYERHVNTQAIHT